MLKPIWFGYIGFSRESLFLNYEDKIKTPTPSIDAYLLGEHSCKTSYWSDLKRRSLP